MPNHARFHFAVTTLIILATLILASCQPSGEKAPPPAPAPSAEAVYVIFEGPWAIVPDPKDANSVLALAPNTKAHRPLGVAPANAHLQPGVYDLTVPAHSAPVALDLDKGFFRTTVDPANVQRALDAKMNRYAIRLPKPESYKAETRYESRVGNAYPPDAGSQQNYVTAVALLYHVNSKTGFSLAGQKDAGGAANPVLLQLDTPNIRFEVEPAGENLGADSCHNHSREAFRDLVKLLGLTLYTDFPDSPDNCHKKDPQLARSEKAQLLPGLEGVGARDVVAGYGTPHSAAALASVFSTAYLELADRRLKPSLLPALYFFHVEGGACMAAIIFGV